MSGQGDDEKDDRELSELLSELRVVLPGVTVLFAFLLTVPFSAGFADASDSDRAAYFVAFLATGVAIVLLVGAIALLAVALAAVVFLVTDVVYPGPVALPLAVGLLTLAAAVWFALPLSRRHRG